MIARLSVEGREHDVTLRRGTGTHQWLVDVDGETFEVTLGPLPAAGGPASAPMQALVKPGSAGAAESQGRRVALRLPGPSQRSTWLVDGQPRHVTVLAASGAVASGAAGGSGRVRVKPPMNGRLERLAVSAGQAVKRGDVLFILEAMKMQNEVRSPADGHVAVVHLAAGATVEPSQVVLELESGPKPA